MPFVREPHFCKPPIWPRLYRAGTVWKCPRCGSIYKNERTRPLYAHDKSKRWTCLESTKPKG